MARVGTTNFNLGKWLDGENPGSGPQDGTLGDGLNGDKNKIDAAMSGHNTDGSHKAAVIDAANLKSTCVDGSSLEQNASTKKLNIKALGVVTAMIADDAVTKAKLNADTPGAGLKQNTDGSLSPDVDGTTVTVNGSNKIALVTTPSPNVIGFVIPFTTNVTTYYPIPAGTITSVSVAMATGTTPSATFTSASSSIRTIRLTNDSSGIVIVYVNGSSIGSIAVDDGDALGAYIQITL